MPYHIKGLTPSSNHCVPVVIPIGHAQKWTFQKGKLVFRTTGLWFLEMPSQANTFQSPTAPLTAPVPVQIEQEVRGNLPWALSSFRTPRHCVVQLKWSRMLAETWSQRVTKLKQIYSLQTDADWVPGNLYAKITLSPFFGNLFSVMSLNACVLHKSEQSSWNGTAGENAECPFKTKYCIMGSSRSGNGKWGHAMRAIWFKST